MPVYGFWIVNVYDLASVLETPIWICYGCGHCTDLSDSHLNHVLFDYPDYPSIDWKMAALFWANDFWAVVQAIGFGLNNDAANDRAVDYLICMAIWTVD